MQYKLKDHLGTFKEPGEIQKIVEEELGGESFQWTTGKAYLASEPSVSPFMILLGNDRLTCKFLRASNAYSSTRVYQHLSQRSHSQKAACVSVCWLTTAINSTLFHYHLLPMLVHWYVVILLLSLLDFLMPSIQGICRPPWIQHRLLEQRSLYSWGVSSSVSALRGGTRSSDQGVSANV
jgi:hypothetical protein